MEAASIPRRKRRRHGPSAKAQWALLAYGGACVAALALATDSWRSAAFGLASTGGAPAVTAPDAESLALDSVAARAADSVVRVGAKLGFVAWTHRGHSLVVTTGLDVGAVLTIEHDARLLDAEAIRADPATGLTLLRVEADLGDTLWQTRRPSLVEGGEWLVAVGAGMSAHLEAIQSRYAAIAVRGAFETLAGAPVLNRSGRLVGIATGTAIVPIGRACGAIRRCA